MFTRYQHDGGWTSVAAQMYTVYFALCAHVLYANTLVSLNYMRTCEYYVCTIRCRVTQLDST